MGEVCSQCRACLTGAEEGEEGRERKHYFEFSDSKIHLCGHLGPVNVRMLTAKCLCSSLGKWGSSLHFKAKERREQVEKFAESPGTGLV